MFHAFWVSLDFGSKPVAKWLGTLECVLTGYAHTCVGTDIERGKTLPANLPWPLVAAGGF